MTQSINNNGLSTEEKSVISAFARVQQGSPILFNIMGNFRDLTGLRFGKLTAIQFSPSKSINGNNKSYWLCECDCGKYTTTRTQRLLKGIAKSCGCYRYDPSKHTYSKRERNIYDWYNRSAKKRKLTFELPLQLFMALINQNCHYCNLPSPEKKNGIDRKNNKIGYIEYNCVPCCSICNMAKRNMPYYIFIDWLKQIASHYQHLC